MVQVVIILPHLTRFMKKIFVFLASNIIELKNIGVAYFKRVVRVFYQLTGSIVPYIATYKDSKGLFAKLKDGFY